MPDRTMGWRHFFFPSVAADLALRLGRDKHHKRQGQHGVEGGAPHRVAIQYEDAGKKANLFLQTSQQQTRGPRPLPKQPDIKRRQPRGSPELWDGDTGCLCILLSVFKMCLGNEIDHLYARFREAGQRGDMMVDIETIYNDLNEYLGGERVRTDHPRTTSRFGCNQELKMKEKKRRLNVMILLRQ